jgi:hypothetical protein
MAMNTGLLKILIPILCILVIAKIGMTGDFAFTAKAKRPLPHKIEAPQEKEDLSNVSTISSTTPDTKPSEQVTAPSEVKTGIYEQLKDGASDNDPTYQPTVSPCTLSMGYKIGSFDNHFGISQNDFIKAVDTSAKLWEDVLDRSLFHYDQNGPLTINLIYDERQARTDDAGYLAIEIQNSKDAAEGIHKTYLEEKATYARSSEELAKQSDAFQVKQTAYEEKVKKYNEQGGAPQAEYAAMMQELATLKEEVTALQAKEKALRTLTETINGEVTHYNELVAYINTLIKKSNSLGAKKFTEGRFTPSTNTIDIYQYNNITKLHRVLAHELGHALGINHNDNVYSIMYAVNSATTTRLTKEDIHSLQDICNQH